MPLATPLLPYKAGNMHNAATDIYVLGRILHELQAACWWEHLELETIQDSTQRMNLLVWPVVSEFWGVSLVSRLSNVAFV